MMLFKEESFLPFLNTQVNCNLSFSLITISKLVNLAKEKKVGSLAISDFYPIVFFEFLVLCQQNNLRPVVGYKFFAFLNGEKRLFAVYPFNNLGIQEVNKTLFSFNLPEDRILDLKHTLPKLKNCFCILEINKIEEFKKFFLLKDFFVSSFLFDWNNFFFGFNFFIFLPEENIQKEFWNKIIPFFSLKTLDSFSKKREILLWLKNSTLSRFFFPEDKNQSFIEKWLNLSELFRISTNDSSFFNLITENWKNFLNRIKIDTKRILTKRKLKEKEEISENLKKICEENLEKKSSLVGLSEKEKELCAYNLTKELEVVSELNFNNYFLTLWEITQELKKKDFVFGFGRGSSVSSLICFLLEFTIVFPSDFNLFFSRFLNSLRKEKLPDIDLDVEDQEGIFLHLFSVENKLVKEKRISKLLVRKKIGWRLALDEAKKFFNLSEVVFKFLFSFYQNNKQETADSWFKETVSFIETISELFYNLQIHPSAIMVSPKPFLNLGVPVMKREDLAFVFWDEKILSDLFSLPKYDFLSLKESLNLLKNFKNSLGIVLPLTNRHIDLSDEKTWSLIKKGLTSGIFHLDTPLFKKMINRFQPKNFSELIFLLAINRPGNLKRIDNISRVKKKNLSFSSSEINKILKETFYSVVFEEQVSQLLSLFFDCSFSESEIKRRNLGLEQLDKTEFIDRSKEKGILEEDAERIFSEITTSFSYTFNKSHSVAYALLIYYLVFLKANNFSFFVTFSLKKFPEKTFFLLLESFFLGYDIVLPEINFSQFDSFSEEMPKKLILGFSLLKHSSVFFEQIINERIKGKYLNLEDFLIRTFLFWPTNLNLTILENWIILGLFQSLVQDKFFLLSNSSNILLYVKLKRTIFDLRGVLDYLPKPFFSGISSNEEKRKFSSLTIPFINELEKKNFSLFLSFFSRWKDIKKKEEKIVFCLKSFLSTINDDENKEYELFLYCIVLDVCILNSLILLTLQDVGGSFKLYCPISIYQKKKNILFIYNECFFLVSFVVKDKISSAIFMCKNVLEYSFLPKK